MCVSYPDTSVSLYACTCTGPRWGPPINAWRTCTHEASWLPESSISRSRHYEWAKGWNTFRQSPCDNYCLSWCDFHTANLTDRSTIINDRTKTKREHSSYRAQNIWFDSLLLRCFHGMKPPWRKSWMGGGIEMVRSMGNYRGLTRECYREGTRFANTVTNRIGFGGFQGFEDTAGADAFDRFL